MNPPAAAANLGPERVRSWVLVARLRQNTALRTTALFVYYLGIIAALVWIYGRGDFKTAPFIYQGF